MFVKKHGVEDNTIMTIGEFSILWCAFEQISFDNKVSSKKIIEYANQISTNDKLLSLCKEIQASAKEYLIDTSDEAISHRIYSEANRGREEERTHIHNFLNNDFSSAEWPGCLLFVQRIRNNLFHGLKLIDTLNSQKEMFSTICNLLEYLVNHADCYE